MAPNDQPIVVAAIGSGLRTFTVVASVLFALGFAAAALWTRDMAPAATDGGVLFLRLFFVLPALGFALGARSAYASTTTIWPDRIQTYNGFWRRELLRAQIRGRRAMPAQTASARLIPTSDDVKSLVVPLSIFAVDGVADWINSLPDLDEEDAAAEAARQVVDPALGTTVEERRKFVQRIRRVAQLGNGAGWLVAAWLMLWPRPYLLAILVAALVPLCALGLQIWAGSLLSLDDTEGDPHPSLAVMFLMPSVMLALRTILDIFILDWQPLLLCTAIGAAVIVFTVARYDTRMRTGRFGKWSILSFVLWGSAYTYGAIAQANVLLDTSPSQSFSATVLAKRISDGSKHTSYYLDLTQWGPNGDSGEMDVGSDLYNRVNTGERVCVYVQSGWLHIRWYYPELCGN